MYPVVTHTDTHGFCSCRSRSSMLLWGSILRLMWVPLKLGSEPTQLGCQECLSVYSFSAFLFALWIRGLFLIISINPPRISRRVPLCLSCRCGSVIMVGSVLDLAIPGPEGSLNITPGLKILLLSHQRPRRHNNFPLALLRLKLIVTLLLLPGDLLLASSELKAWVIGKGQGKACGKRPFSY